MGAVGDVVQTDYVPATVLNTDNLVGHMLFGFDRSHIQTVWANGRVIWPTPLDVNDIATQATRAASGLWKRMEALDG